MFALAKTCPCEGTGRGARLLFTRHGRLDRAIWSGTPMSNVIVLSRAALIETGLAFAWSVRAARYRTGSPGQSPDQVGGWAMTGKGKVILSPMPCPDVNAVEPCPSPPAFARAGLRKGRHDGGEWTAHGGPARVPAGAVADDPATADHSGVEDPQAALRLG